MILGGQVFDRESRRGAQAIGDHENLVTNLVVQLNLELRIVLGVLLNQVDFEAVDTTIIIDVLEEYQLLVVLSGSCPLLLYPWPS